MGEIILTRTVKPLHPILAILLAATIPLFFGALLSDWAYGASYQSQWKNFAAWLTLGGLVFGGMALAWTSVSAIASSDKTRRRWLPPALLLATCAAGAFSALIHAKDAWAAMPNGLILSAVALLLAIAANWAAHARVSEEKRP